MSPLADGSLRARLPGPGAPADGLLWAKRLGVSVEATSLLLDADFVDLHCDLEVPVRLVCYDPTKHHGRNERVKAWWGHTDYPRIREAGFTGIAYDLATNPFRPKRNRLATTLANLERMKERLAAFPDDFQLVRTHADYRAAVGAGKTAFWLTIQGGNAFSADLDVLAGPLGDELHRITVVHLTSSDLGGTSSPLGRDSGLTDRGRELVRLCNERKILVDLAHAGKKTFWDILSVHASDAIPVVTHTGVDGCHRHWRNLDDDQVRAIADRGGVVGIMYQGSFLTADGSAFSWPRRAILDHMEHVMRLVGDAHCAIGTDYDGMITPPSDLLDVTDHPLLVQDMLDRGWSEERIRGILGGNYLRVVEATRP